MKLIRLALTVAFLATFVGAASAADTEGLWKKNCMSCHGADGKGKTKAGRVAKVKDLTDAAYQGTFTDEYALERLKNGITEDGKVRMKPYGDVLSEEEMKALIAYVRQFKG